MISIPTCGTYITQTAMYCQNKLCGKHSSKDSYNGAIPTDRVCRYCGFKTLGTFDIQGFKDLMSKQNEK